MYICLQALGKGGREGALCALLYSCSCMRMPTTIMRHCARLCIVALEQRYGPLTAVPALSGQGLTGLGNRPTWPCPCPGEGNAYASLPALHPLLDSDRSMVWQHRCVYMPPDCSHRPNLCSRARCVRVWPRAKQPGGGGGTCLNFHSGRGGGGGAPPQTPSPPPPSAQVHLKTWVSGPVFRGKTFRRLQRRPYIVYVLHHVCSIYLVLQTTMPQGCAQ